MEAFKDMLGKQDICQHHDPRLLRKDSLGGIPPHHHTVHSGAQLDHKSCTLCVQGRSKKARRRSRVPRTNKPRTPGERRESIVFAVGRFRVTHMDKKDQGSGDQLDQSEALDSEKGDEEDPQRKEGYNLQSMFKDVKTESTNGVVATAAKRKKSLVLFSLRRGSDPVGVKVPLSQPVVEEEPLFNAPLKTAPVQTSNPVKTLSSQPSLGSGAPDDTEMAHVKMSPTRVTFIVSPTVAPEPVSPNMSPAGVSPLTPPVQDSPITTPVQVTPMTPEIFPLTPGSPTNPVPSPLNVSPATTPVQASPTTTPVQASPTTTPVQASLTTTPVQASLTTTPVQASPTTTSLNLSPALSSRIVSPSPTSLHLSPALSSRKVSSNTTPLNLSPTPTSIQVSPALSSRKASPALSSRNVSPALSSRKVSPTPLKGYTAPTPLMVSPIAPHSILRNATTFVKVDETSPSSSPFTTSATATSKGPEHKTDSLAIVNADKVSPTAAPVKVSPTIDHMKVSATMTPIKVSPSSGCPLEIKLEVGSVAIVKASPDSQREVSVVCMAEVVKGEEEPAVAQSPPEEEKEDEVEMEDIKDCRVSQEEEGVSLEEKRRSGHSQHKW
ncbi:cell wall protein DAN4-like [Coregonus clupeaformis]|uniref:cell wall protein DAN4-like n=1 Tax=Coregonus clupeaformis TaxID=59861 RepID=UPI001E1C8CDA|nr:cell wall protein DAN4-like [Coregonus clupeaformis]